MCRWLHIKEQCADDRKTAYEEYKKFLWSQKTLASRQSQHQMQRRLFLYIVVREHPALFQLFSWFRFKQHNEQVAASSSKNKHTGKNQALLINWSSIFALYEHFAMPDLIFWRDIDSDCLAS